MKYNKFLNLLFFLISLSALGQQLTTQQNTTINTYLESQVSGEVPGLAVGIVKDGKVTFEKYIGYANLSHQILVDEHTRFNIASVAKQFTALCILQLVLDSKIDLEEDFRKYLPSFFPDIQDSIKIKTLLNHSSGIRDFYDLMSIQNKVWWREEGLDNEDVLQLLQQQSELNFAPNTAHLYSNSNYTILTKIVEEVSNKPFHEYSRSVFQKLNMNETHFLKNYMSVIPHQALPYSNWGNGQWKQYPMMTDLYGDGFLFTTLNDQLAYEKLLQGQNNNLPLITLSQKPIPNTKIQDYGYGLEHNEKLGYPSVNHSGSTGSYNAQTLRFPEESLSIVVMSNNGNIWSGNIANKIAAVMLKEKSPKSTPLPEISVRRNKKLDNQQLIGEYLSPEDVVIRIVEEEGELYWKMDNNNPIKLLRMKSNLYHWEPLPKLKIAFELSDSNEGLFTVYYPGSEPRIHQKLKSFVANKDYLSSIAGNYFSEELSIGFSLELNDQNELLFNRTGESDQETMEVIQKDQLLLYDFRMKVERDAQGHISDILVTYSRVKNLRFKKKS